MARPRQVSDQEIIEAARDCFVNHGPGVSTALIAERIGLSQAALFKRFGTKQELMITALIPPEIPPWIEAVAQGPDGRPVPEQLLEHGLRIAGFFQEMVPRLSTLKASGCHIPSILSRFEIPPPVRGLVALTQWFEAARSQDLVDCQPRSTAVMFLGALGGRGFLMHTLGLQDETETYVSDLVGNLWRGIAPMEEP